MGTFLPPHMEIVCVRVGADAPPNEWTIGETQLSVQRAPNSSTANLTSLKGRRRSR